MPSSATGRGTYDLMMSHIAAFSNDAYTKASPIIADKDEYASLSSSCLITLTRLCIVDGIVFSFRNFIDRVCYDMAMSAKYTPQTRVSYDVYLDDGSHQSSPGYAFDFYRGRDIARVLIKQAYVDGGIFGRYTLRNVSRGSYKRPVIESMRGHKDAETGLWVWTEVDPNIQQELNAVKIKATTDPSDFVVPGSAPFDDITVQARDGDKLVGVIVAKQRPICSPLFNCQLIGKLCSSISRGHINRVYCITKFLADHDDKNLQTNMIAKLITAAKGSCVSSHYIDDNLQLASYEYNIRSVFQESKIESLAKVISEDGVFVAVMRGTY